jgi:hypothetical protein
MVEPVACSRRDLLSRRPPRVPFFPAWTSAVVTQVTAADTTDTAQGLRAAAERIVGAHGLQGEMPGPEPPPPDWWRHLVEALRRAGAWLAHLLDGLPPLHWIGRALAWLWSLFTAIGSPVLRVLLALVLVALVCGLAVWLVEAMGRWRRRADAVAPAEAAGLDDVRDAILDDADALARAGRYAEAVHALLLNGLAHVRRAAPQAIADSLTSREIVRDVDLPVTARAALDDLVIRAELGHFGLFPIERRDYDTCRGRFAALVAALAGPSAEGAAP